MRTHIAFSLLGLSAALTACTPPKPDLAYEAELRSHLAQHGLHADPNFMRWWSDSSERTVFVLGEKTTNSQRAYSLLLLSKDGNESKVVDLNGINLQKQWVDSDGMVWSTPSFYTEEERASSWLSVDSRSGLFIAHGPKPSTNQIWVGRMNSTDGWLFTDTLFASAGGYGFKVQQDGPNIVVSENWSFKVQGAKSPRPHHWVYSPDPKDPAKYILTDSYW